MIATAFRLALVAGIAAPGAAFAAHSGWSKTDQAGLRLLMVAREPGRIEGGVEIALEPEWYTYWRNPGEAGVPPSFDFSGSDNVGAVEVRYPAPERHDDGMSVSLIYRDQVVFPLAITAIDPTKPVTLSVAARFGVCNEVCVPVATDASLTLAPDAAADPLSTERLKSFDARVPVAPEPGRFAIESVTPEGDALLVDVRAPDSSYSDLFANPPEGWYIGQPAFVSRDGGVSRYRLSLAGRPRDAEVSGQSFDFVAVAGGEAIEETVKIK